ncbi:MAG TPA: phosphoribosylglycinamide synthetase [Sphingobium sp.]
MLRPIEPMHVPYEALRQLKVMFVAKHALGDGTPHAEDGNHAVYHHEVRTILEDIGFDLRLSNDYRDLFDAPGVDYVFPLLNRGGFLNSEMMLPLLCTRLGLPFLGASPILRGMSDDKHLSKLAAVARGVPTAPWAIYRRGAPVTERDCPRADRLVIKPNASSASWGVRDASDWAGVVQAVGAIHAEGHDAIVEPFINGSDIEVPVITIMGEPVIMPMMLFEQADPSHLRTYWEKRDLVDRTQKYDLVDFEEPDFVPLVRDMTARLAREYMPFDYGRFEFRFDAATGKVVFLEQNLNCNLWSQKVFGRSAARAGLTQRELIETIVAEGLRRHGLIDISLLEAAE